MKTSTIVIGTFLLTVCPSLTLAEITRQECIDQGGQVVGDIGNGAIFSPDYLCPDSNLAPSDIVVASPGEPIASEGEVCCGGTGEGVAFINNGGGPPGLGGDMGGDGDGADLPTMGGSDNVDVVTITRTECEAQGGSVVGDIGNGAIFQPDYRCPNSTAPPTDIVIAEEGEPIAFEGEVCCGGTGEGLSYADSNPGIGDGDGGEEFLPGNGPPSSLPEVTLLECQEELDGIAVEDIGDGAILAPGYICESSGKAPVGVIVANLPALPSRNIDGDAIPVEGGQVCCEVGMDDGSGGGLPLPPIGDRDELTEQECLDQDGVITGDIGDGAIFSDEYRCETNDLPPIGNIIQDEAPFAVEGEVCCGKPVETAETDLEDTNQSTASTDDDDDDDSGGSLASIVFSVVQISSIVMTMIF